MAAHRKQDAGATLLEVTIAAATLAVFLGSSLPMVAALRLNDRTIDEHTLGWRSLDNVLEQIHTIGADDLTQLAAQPADQLSATLLPSFIHTRLRNPRLELRVVQETNPTLWRRVTARLAWQSCAGQAVPAAQLTTWIFPSPQQLP